MPRLELAGQLRIGGADVGGMGVKVADAVPHPGPASFGGRGVCGRGRRDMGAGVSAERV